MRGGKREGAGRPVVIPGMHHPVNIRLTEKDFQLIKSAADYEGKSVSQFIRDIIAAYLMR